MSNIGFEHLFVLVGKDTNSKLLDILGKSTLDKFKDKIFFYEKKGLLVKNGQIYGVDPTTRDKINALEQTVGSPQTWGVDSDGNNVIIPPTGLHGDIARIQDAINNPWEDYNN